MVQAATENSLLSGLGRSSSCIQIQWWKSRWLKERIKYALLDMRVSLSLHRNLILQALDEKKQQKYIFQRITTLCYALWLGLTKHPDRSTGPLARWYTHSLTPLTCSLAPLIHSQALLTCSLAPLAHKTALTRSLAHSRARRKVNDLCW